MVTDIEVFEFLGISMELLRPYTIRDVMKFLENQPDLIHSIENIIQAEKEIKRLYALQAVYNRKKSTNLDLSDEAMESMVFDLESQKKSIYAKRQKILHYIFQKFLK